MVSPVPYRATLREAAYDADPDTKNPRISSAWMGMSKSGDITAPVIYAHSGNPEDFALLRKEGIDVKGKIVLVRYSNPYSYRGFKALTAEKEGVAAMLIYSDPAEDGYGKGKVFPDGPWGPESHIQRGAIEYDFQQAGDPTTPGWPSLPGALHIPAAGASPVPKIMALPISWHDAKPLMEQMDGPEAPDAWQGGLPFKYHLGGGRVRAHLKIQMKESLKANYVVEGRIRGRDYPDQWILAGNHRDAWVFGGVRSEQRHGLHDGNDARPGPPSAEGNSSPANNNVFELGRGRDQFRRLRGMERAIRPGAPAKSRGLPQRRHGGHGPRFSGAEHRFAGALVGRSQQVRARPFGQESLRRVADLPRQAAAGG